MAPGEYKLIGGISVPGKVLNKREGEQTTQYRSRIRQGTTGTNSEKREAPEQGNTAGPENTASETTGQTKSHGAGTARRAGNTAAESRDVMVITAPLFKETDF